MLTMNYGVTLPADYDMHIIRDRVARLGSAMDHYEHLIFKAYLMSEAGKDGNLENRYAPFYLWQSDAGMHSFLSGDGFRNLTRSFGWIPVRVGIVHSFQPGNLQSLPVYATHERMEIPPHTNMAALWESEAERQAQIHESMVARVVSFDPSSWTLVRFVLWNQAPVVDAGVPLLTVLHLSAPGLAVREAEAKGMGSEVVPTLPR